MEQHSRIAPRLGMMCAPSSRFPARLLERTNIFRISSARYSTNRAARNHAGHVDFADGEGVEFWMRCHRLCLGQLLLGCLLVKRPPARGFGSVMWWQSSSSVATVSLPSWSGAAQQVRFLAVGRTFLGVQFGATPLKVFDFHYRPALRSLEV